MCFPMSLHDLNVPRTVTAQGNPLVCGCPFNEIQIMNGLLRGAPISGCATSAVCCKSSWKKSQHNYNDGSNCFVAWHAKAQFQPQLQRWKSFNWWTSKVPVTSRTVMIVLLAVFQHRIGFEKYCARAHFETLSASKQRSPLKSQMLPVSQPGYRLWEPIHLPRQFGIFSYSGCTAILPASRGRHKRDVCLPAPEHSSQPLWCDLDERRSAGG